jgi:hypothetical protein
MPAVSGSDIAVGADDGVNSEQGHMVVIRSEIDAVVEEPFRVVVMTAV